MLRHLRAHEAGTARLPTHATQRTLLATCAGGRLCKLSPSRCARVNSVAWSLPYAAGVTNGATMSCPADQSVVWRFFKRWWPIVTCNTCVHTLLSWVTGNWGQKEAAFINNTGTQHIAHQVGGTLPPLALNRWPTQRHRSCHRQPAALAVSGHLLLEVRLRLGRLWIAWAPGAARDASEPRGTPPACHPCGASTQRCVRGKHACLLPPPPPRIIQTGSEAARPLAVTEPETQSSEAHLLNSSRRHARLHSLLLKRHHRKGGAVGAGPLRLLAACLVQMKGRGQRKRGGRAAGVRGGKR